MNRFYPFFPFPPGQIQERYYVQNPQNNGIDPHYGSPPYGGYYPPAPPPPAIPQGMNDVYTRYSGYQQGRPPLPPSHYPYSYPNQQRWRQPPQPSHRSFMDDLGSFAKYLNPFGSAHAEEVPPAPTTSPPKPVIPQDTSLGDRRRLSDMAVRLNEGDKGGLGWAGMGQGASFGAYQGDPSALNPPARKALSEILQLMRHWGVMPRDEHDYLKERMQDKLTTKGEYEALKRVFNPYLNIKEVKEIVQRMDDELAKNNHAEIVKVNEKSLKYRGRTLDPVEQAAIAIWGNKNDDLKDTAAKFASNLRNASTEDVLNYLINQKEYQPHPGKSAKDAENRAKRRERHMVSTGHAIKQAIDKGVISAFDVSTEAQNALNSVLKKIGSKVVFNFEIPDRSDAKME